jgi:disulfide bond formation protein DsbB
VEPLQLTNARARAYLYIVLAALAAAAMLAAAHAFERIGGYHPCALCLRQREVYWGALAVAASGLLLLGRRPELARVMAALLAALFLTGAVIAAFHVGVEMKWWPAPTGCVGGSADAADMASILAGERQRLTRCDEAAWSMWGLSMAGWNALVSLGLAALGLAAATRTNRIGSSGGTAHD